MPYFSVEEAQTTAKEPEMIAQPTVSSQQHKKRDGCNPSDTTSVNMCATVQQEQLLPITSSSTAAAGTSLISLHTLCTDTHGKVANQLPACVSLDLYRQLLSNTQLTPVQQLPADVLSAYQGCFRLVVSAGHKREGPLKYQNQNTEASADALSQDCNIISILMVMHVLSIMNSYQHFSKMCRQCVCVSHAQLICMCILHIGDCRSATFVC